MSPRGGALAAAVAALLLSAGCRDAALPAPAPDLAARSCRLRLLGPLRAELPCEALARELPEGWLLSLALPEGGAVVGSLEHQLGGEGPGRGWPARGGYLHLREVASGLTYAGPVRGALRVSLSGGRPQRARLEAVVSRVGGGEEEPPLRLELDAVFAPASEAAGRMASGR